MALAEKILEILKDGHYCKVYALGDRGFQLKYGKQYSAPELSFAKLKALSELFGTDAIDVDNYSQSGCESCDYGSDYGHEIQIYNPTKNVEEMTRLTGIDLVDGKVYSY